MAIDQTLIGSAAASIMDQLDGYGPDAEVELVGLVVSVGENEGGNVHYHFAAEGRVRAWQARGLLEAAARQLV